MGAAVGAALKKIAVAILSEPKVLKNVLFAILVVVVAMLLPTIFVVSIFSGDFEVDTASLQQYVEDNLSAADIALLTSVEDTMEAIEEAMIEQPFMKKAWNRIASSAFNVAHDLTDSIAKDHPLYEIATRMQELVKDSDPVIHHTFDAGEGVLIPAEILHHAKHGCRSFVILQPFGCLPNHVVGRGIVKKLKQMYPDVQILPLDYDPDVSFANVENRLQMLIINTKLYQPDDFPELSVVWMQLPGERSGDCRR